MNKKRCRIVEIAQSRNSGARALRSVLEDILMDLMYDVPDMDKPNKIMITEKFILGESKPLISLDPIKKEVSLIFMHIIADLFNLY